MHISELARAVVGHAAARLPGHGSAPQPVPIEIEVTLDEPVTRPQHLLDGIKRIKDTPWYRGLRRRGLHVLPLGYQHGRVLLVVGTAASLGAAYLAYKRLKHRHARQE